MRRFSIVIEWGKVEENAERESSLDSMVERSDPRDIPLGFGPPPMQPNVSPYEEDRRK